MSKNSKDSKDSKEKKSLIYLMNVREGRDVNGFFVQTEKQIYEGLNGITIKFYNVESKTKQRKVTIKSNDDGFLVMDKKDGKEDKKNMTKAELEKFVKADKDLTFVADFLKTQKGGEWLNRTKKASKKSSKKHSKTISDKLEKVAKVAKSVKTHSKKAKRAMKRMENVLERPIKKASKKSSKKSSSKKASKKASKKTSKKTSRRRYKKI
jgi:hypothetical protein